MRSVCNFTTIAAFAVLSTDNTDRLFHANKIPRVLLAALAKGLRRDQYTQWTATCIALFSRLVQVTVTNGYSLPVEQLEALISLCTKVGQSPPSKASVTLFTPLLSPDIYRSEYARICDSIAYTKY